MLFTSDNSDNSKLHHLLKVLLKILDGSSHLKTSYLITLETRIYFFSLNAVYF